MSQLVFSAHSLSGLLALLALFHSSPAAALAALLGCAVSSASAPLLRPAPDPLLPLGLFGFNGALFGAALACLTPLPLLPLALATALGAFSTTAISCLLLRLLGPLPYLSLPFNIAALAALSSASPLPSLPAALPAALADPLPAAHRVEALLASLPAPPPGAPSLADLDRLLLDSPLHDALSGCAGMAFASAPASGALLLLALAIARPFPRLALEAPLSALMGAAIGAGLMALTAAAPASLIALGLHGFNPALTALALHSFLAPRGSGLANLAAYWGYLGLGAVAATALNAALGSWLAAHAGLPALAVPFCVTAIGMIGIAKYLPNMKSRF